MSGWRAIVSSNLQDLLPDPLATSTAAYSLLQLPTTTPAYSLLPTTTAAYSLLPTTTAAYSLLPTTTPAYSLLPSRGLSRETTTNQCTDKGLAAVLATEHYCSLCCSAPDTILLQSSYNPPTILLQSFYNPPTILLQSSYNPPTILLQSSSYRIQSCRRSRWCRRRVWIQSVWLWVV